jgi:hypothetical protein
MKTLKESLLDDIDVTMQRGEDFVKYANKFGYYFIFDNCICYEDIAGLFSVAALKKLTNGLPYNNDKIERGQFDKRNKVKMFANWLDNTNLTDIGVNINELTKSNFVNKEWRIEFGKKVEDYCVENNVFNKPDIAHLFTSTAVVNERGTNLTLFIVNTKHMSKAIRLNYKINQNI